MSDPTDTGQRNPLSSSTSHASSTSALSVSVHADGAPAMSMAAQDDVAAPAPPSGGEADLLAHPKLEAETDPEIEAEISQPQAAGRGDTAAAEQPEPAGEPEAVQVLAPSHEPAPEGCAEYSQPIAELHAEVAAPNPGEQPLIAASISSAAEVAGEASAFVDDLVYTATDEAAAIADAVADLDARPPSTDEATPAAPLPRGAFPEVTNELRAAAPQTIAENEARQERALALFDQVSRRFTAALEETGVDAARLTFKVMEFAQASLKNNLELAKSYAAARSVPDVFGLHTAYITRQFELLNAQAEELREITAKITLRSTASLKPPTDPAVKTLDNR